jgi:zinc transport system ATP-binding protein
VNRGPGDPPLLEVADLTVRRGRETLLQSVSLAVRRHSVHVIVGPNGAGKTTLLSAVLGETAFSGSIVANWRQSGRIGYVPQSFAVDSTLPVTVGEFLALTRQRRPVCLGVGSATHRRVSGLLDRIGLRGFERRQLSVLSGGELRRVLLANALDPLPELLILDEPASGLDQSAVRSLEQVLRSLKASVTVLMVSHDLGHVRRAADRVTVLDRRIVREGTPAEVLPEDQIADLILADSQVGALQ